jgi:hypothetical protein
MLVNTAGFEVECNKTRSVSKRMYFERGERLLYTNRNAMGKMVALVGDDSYMRQLLRGKPLKGECTTNIHDYDMRSMN